MSSMEKVLYREIAKELDVSVQKIKEKKKELTPARYREWHKEKKREVVASKERAPANEDN